VVKFFLVTEGTYVRIPSRFSCSEKEGYRCPYRALPLRWACSFQPRFPGKSNLATRHDGGARGRGHELQGGRIMGPRPGHPLLSREGPPFQQGKGETYEPQEELQQSRLMRQEMVNIQGELQLSKLLQQEVEALLTEKSKEATGLSYTWGFRRRAA